MHTYATNTHKVSKQIKTTIFFSNSKWFEISLDYTKIILTLLYDREATKTLNQTN